MKYCCLFAGWTEYRPGGRDRANQISPGLQAPGFFRAGFYDMIQGDDTRKTFFACHKTFKRLSH